MNPAPSPLNVFCLDFLKEKGDFPKIPEEYQDLNVENSTQGDKM